MFVGSVALLYEARRVARQLQVEMWLDPSPLLTALNLKPVHHEKLRVDNYVA